MPANVTPFLWFQGQAHDAARFYCGIFKGSKIVRKDAMSATVRPQGRTRDRDERIQMKHMRPFPSPVHL